MAVPVMFYVNNMNFIFQFAYILTVFTELVNTLVVILVTDCLKLYKVFWFIVEFMGIFSCVRPALWNRSMRASQHVSVRWGQLRLHLPSYW